MDSRVHGVAPRPPGPATAAAGPAAGGANTRRQRLQRATQGFEAMFLSYLVKSMHSEEGLFADTESGSAGNDVLRELADEQMAQALASRGGIGLAPQLMATLSARLGAAATPPHAPEMPPDANEKVNEP
jgi:Rod binding domain-containing protein